MSKSQKPRKKPICKVGDRIHALGKEGTIQAILPTRPKLKYEVKWSNGNVASYSEYEIEVIGYQIEPVQFNWKVGDRCKFGKLIGTVVKLSGGLVKVKFDEFDSTTQGAWVSKEHIETCLNESEPVDSLKELVDSPEQLNLLEGLTGGYLLKTTETQSQFSNQTLSIQSLVQISEISTPVQAIMTSLSVDFPAPTHQEPETELELLTYLQNLEQCSDNSSDVLEKLNPNLSFWSSLPDLSIEDLERGWEDCAWVDTKASIQSSRERMNLERSLRGSDYLSFPTLLSGRGRGCRDAGLVNCEKWWKQHVIQTIGLQLSAEAIAGLHGFPANWYRSISPPSIAQPDTQDDLQPENLEVKLSPSPKLESPSNGSNGCGQSLTDGRVFDSVPNIIDSLGKSQTQPTRESQQIGSLYQYTSNKANKEGIIQTYPLYIGEGERPREDESLWYWGISWVEKVKGKWKDRSSSIPRSSLKLARRLMREKFLVGVTVEVCQLKWLWTTEIGSYLIGETKPEACPRLAILSFEERQLFISGLGWGESTLAARNKKREVIQKAMAEGKSFSEIKELLCNG